MCLKMWKIRQIRICCQGTNIFLRLFQKKVAHLQLITMKSEPFFQHFIILSLITMAEATASHRRIIVPAPISNNSQAYHHQHSHEHFQEQSKTTRQNKLYIAPKHRTHPLALDNPHPIPSNARRFPPNFDTFELSHLYSGRPLTEEELALFDSLHELDEDKFKTPERESHNAEKGWSSFKLVDNHLHNTSASSKLMRGGVEGKKSRPKEKGLRKLSQRAYEIVLNMRSASYKQVANRLVDELNSEQELDQEGKDEQNIKRRVYDALNVLIALGVLRKEGRKIVGDRDNQLHFEQGLVGKVRQQFAEKEAEINRKREQIALLEQKHLILRQMAERHTQKIHQWKSNQSNPDRKITFPFLALCHDKEGKYKGWSAEDGGCVRIDLRWQGAKRTWGHFDIDLLVEYQRALQKIDET